jgi:hypothetical protein
MEWKPSLPFCKLAVSFHVYQEGLTQPDIYNATKREGHTSPMTLGNRRKLSLLLICYRRWVQVTI